MSLQDFLHDGFFHLICFLRHCIVYSVVLEAAKDAQTYTRFFRECLQTHKTNVIIPGKNRSRDIVERIATTLYFYLPAGKVSEEVAIFIRKKTSANPFTVSKDL